MATELVGRGGASCGLSRRFNPTSSCFFADVQIHLLTVEHNADQLQAQNDLFRFRSRTSSEILDSNLRER
jgi:hypothetical protein